MYKVRMIAKENRDRLIDRHAKVTGRDDPACAVKCPTTNQMRLASLLVNISSLELQT